MDDLIGKEGQIDGSILCQPDTRKRNHFLDPQASETLSEDTYDCMAAACAGSGPTKVRVIGPDQPGSLGQAPMQHARGAGSAQLATPQLCSLRLVGSRLDSCMTTSCMQLRTHSVCAMPELGLGSLLVATHLAAGTTPISGSDSGAHTLMPLLPATQATLRATTASVVAPEVLAAVSMPAAAAVLSGCWPGPLLAPPRAGSLQRSTPVPAVVVQGVPPRVQEDGQAPVPPCTQPTNAGDGDNAQQEQQQQQHQHQERPAGAAAAAVQEQGVVQPQVEEAAAGAAGAPAVSPPRSSKLQLPSWLCGPSPELAAGQAICRATLASTTAALARLNSPPSPACMLGGGTGAGAGVAAGHIPAACLLGPAAAAAPAQGWSTGWAVPAAAPAVVGLPYSLLGGVSGAAPGFATVPPAAPGAAECVGLLGSGSSWGSPAPATTPSQPGTLLVVPGEGDAGSCSSSPRAACVSGAAAGDDMMMMAATGTLEQRQTQDDTDGEAMAAAPPAAAEELVTAVRASCITEASSVLGGVSHDEEKAAVVVVVQDDMQQLLQAHEPRAHAAVVVRVVGRAAVAAAKASEAGAHAAALPMCTDAAAAASGASQ